MARPPKPWFRDARDQWCVTYQGKLHVLARGKKNRNEAYRAFLELTRKTEGLSTACNSCRQVCSMFIEHSRTNLKPNTYDGYKRFLEPFGDEMGALDGNEVQPRHVTKFLDAHAKWNQTTRYNAITAIKRAWSWAHDEGHLTLNPLKQMKRPKPLRREDIPDDEEMRRFLAHARPEFREFLTFIRETGCRPGEAAMIQKRHVNLADREVRFKIGEDKTSGKTGRTRVIHLNENATTLLSRLIIQHPTGHLFRNSKGNPWHRHGINCAVRRIRLVSGLDERTVTYALRHQWITDALASGLSVAIVAEMAGTSPDMVARVYSHLSDKKALLMKAANDVRPKA